MAIFLNTTQARGEVEGILTSAKTQIVLISPFVKINDDLINRLYDAGARRRIRIKLVCREGSLKPEERVKLRQIENLELLFNEKVHAKCFFNESRMVITSLNLYDSSSGDNQEMGVLLTSKDDELAFQNAKDEAQYILRASVQPPIESAKSPSANTSQNEVHGYCIRCRSAIAPDPDKPYCPSCYSDAKYDIDDDSEPIENYCFLCGGENESSLGKPLCYSCYKKVKSARTRS